MSAYQATGRNITASFRMDFAHFTTRFWKWWSGLSVEPSRPKFVHYL
jgi:hypothetical protein